MWTKGIPVCRHTGILILYMDENNFQQNGRTESPSATFRNVPNSSEDISERVRKENHTLTVREVVKLFEEKGVDITERSIVNYCHPNKYGACLLDSYYDQNERKYYIAPESVEKAIEEVRARKIKMNNYSTRVPNASETPSETFRNIPNSSETNNKEQTSDNKELEETKKENEKLKEKVFDLSVASEAKGQIIIQMQEERKETLKMMRDDRTFIGKLKTKLLQLGAGENTPEEEENNNSYRGVEVEEKNPLQEQNEVN